MNAPSRRSTNLSLDGDMLSEARDLKINLSRAAEDGIRAAVASAKAERWKAENKAALESSNAYVERNGLPLDTYRQF